MKSPPSFESRLHKKLCEQVKGRKAGFLLGAGASFLNGTGYPLAAELWPVIKTKMTKIDQRLVDGQLVKESSTLEQALDAIDHGRDEDSPLRHRVTSAIAETFHDRKPTLDSHRQFVALLTKRRERRVPVFTLNYDPLVELAADQEQVRLFDGFHGTVEGYFCPSCFGDFWGSVESRRGRPVPVPFRGIINLYKLHGSLGWYVVDKSQLKRIRPDVPCPSGWRHLMIPPQNRKAADTGISPYATIWSEFRAYLSNDSTRLLNRLICVGYGLGDGHVNAVIQSALSRRNFTLVILARSLGEETFRRWMDFKNVIITTASRSSIYGEEGPGHREAWAFEWLAKEV